MAYMLLRFIKLDESLASQLVQVIYLSSVQSLSRIRLFATL